MSFILEHLNPVVIDGTFLVEKFLDPVRPSGYKGYEWAFFKSDRSSLPIWDAGSSWFKIPNRL
jgi:hypothetical protein